MKRETLTYGNFRTSGCLIARGFRKTITFARPIDAEQWRVGDVVSTGGVERVVTWVGEATVELAPATWWRLAWLWLRRKAGL